MFKNNLLSFLVGVFMLTLLSGCLYDPNQDMPKQGTEQYIVYLKKELSDQGVAVVNVGQTYCVIIPANALFHGQSANFKENAAPLLKQVVELVNQYDVVDVSVAGFNEQQAKSKRAHALTAKQAQRVADYLWDKGMHSRLVYVSGLNGRFPIATNRTQKGVEQNRRIEIDFNVLPPI